MVYVDNARHPYGRLLLSHMVADTPRELHEMAYRLGLKREWCHNGDHYDICAKKRALAINMGAIELSTREIARKRREIRALGYGNEWKIMR